MPGGQGAPGMGRGVQTVISEPDKLDAPLS
jgi:hypothetical protein